VAKTPVRIQWMHINYLIMYN